MKSLLLSTLYTALRLYAGADLFDRIAARVLAMVQSPDLTGAQKMAKIMDFFAEEALHLGTTLVRTIAEVVLLKFKAA